MRVVLAYSGGLDTCVILHWIRETYGADVVTYTGDVGQGGDELEKARRAAESTGADEIVIEDLRETFVRDYIFPALRANAVYEWYYLMGTPWRGRPWPRDWSKPRSGQVPMPSPMVPRARGTIR